MISFAISFIPLPEQYAIMHEAKFLRGRSYIVCCIVALLHTVCTCRELKEENAALRKQVETVTQEKESLDDKLRCVHMTFRI